MLNKYPDKFPEEAPLIILDIKSAVCMNKNGMDTEHTRHIVRRVNDVRNGENCKMHKIDWCKGGLKLADIETNNVGESDLYPRMINIMLRIDNLDITLVQEGWQDIG